MDSSGSEEGQLPSSCEHGNEQSGSMKAGNVLPAERLSGSYEELCYKE
jgi:hypothetical protein